MDSAATSNLQAYLFGQIDFDACLALQQRLVYEASGSVERQITLLICEHGPLITVGRSGSRMHIQLNSDELASEQLDIRWLNRGGGCVLHSPGQLAIYPIVPLERFSWTVGECLSRLEQGLLNTLRELGIHGTKRPGWPGVWGRTGQLAAIGVAVKSWTSYHGAFLNVSPAMRLVRRVWTDFLENSPLSSLMVERQGSVKMTAVRAGLVRHLAESFGIEHYHLHTSHPLVAQPPQRTRKPAARAN
jgi:lipoyl(octanoyl) transferase